MKFAVKYSVLLILYVTVGAVSCVGQTLISKCNSFIGKSVFEIKTINAQFGTEPFVNESNLAENDDGIKTLEFRQLKDSLYYAFQLKSDTCVNVIVSTQCEQTKNMILNDIKKGSDEFVGDKWIREINGTKFYWRQMPSLKSQPNLIFVFFNARLPENAAQTR